MNVASLRERVRSKTGALPPTRADAASRFNVVSSHPGIADYLTHCVSDDVYLASDMRIAGYERLVQENLESAGPGCYIYPFGFVVLATSVGGNAICGDAATGAVYWFDHSQFFDLWITYEDPVTGELEEFDQYSAENIRTAGKKIGDDFGQVMLDLLSDRLTELVVRYD
jgi:hypothetical protein